MSETSDADRDHEPTQQRLEDARRQGDVPQSADLTAAAGLGGFVAALVIFGQDSADRMGHLGVWLLSAQGELGRAALAAVFTQACLAVAPMVLLPAAASLAAVFAQRAAVVSAERIVPKLSRISPVATARQKFGAEGLTDFAKSFAKLCLVSLVLFGYLSGQANDILALVTQDSARVAQHVAGLLVGFIALAVLLSAALGAVDLLLQHLRFRARNRMSRQEVLEEMKRSEGDPHLKAERRGRGRAIALNAMLVDVPKADVVIVNPTHYAVALRWDRKSGRAPQCVAKGVDEVALKIREIAAEAGVPLHRDPATARALHATIDIGDEVRREHYRAVAAAVRFADAMRRRAARHTLSR